MVFSSIFYVALGVGLGYFGATTKYEEEEFWGRAHVVPTQLEHFDAQLQNTEVVNAWDVSTHSYKLGRYTRPFKSVEYPVTDVSYPWLTLKRWAYYSVATTTHSFTFAIVQVNYASVAFAYMVDLHSKQMFEYSALVPFGLTTNMSPSSIEGCSSFTAWNSSMEVCFDKRKKAWIIKADVRAYSKQNHEARHIVADYEMVMGDSESLVMHFPLANNPYRPAYTHKLAGAPANGILTVDGKQNNIENGLGSVDWTKSMAMRRTEWNWASSTFHAVVQNFTNGEIKTKTKCTIGINLSAKVYDIDGHSQENAVWVDGKVYSTEGVLFEVPETGKTQETDLWGITSIPINNMTQSTTSVHVQLKFRPWGARTENDDKILVKSKFLQAYGVYNGQITITTVVKSNLTETMVVEVVDAYGVAEDHFALW
eukprot:CFRG1015T1